MKDIQTFIMKSCTSKKKMNSKKSDIRGSEKRSTIHAKFIR